MNAKVSVLFLCVETIIYFLYNLHDCNFKGTLSGLRQHLATESPLKMMKNTFYFTTKALFVLKIFKFLYWLFGHVAKRRLDQKDQVNVKFYDVTGWLTNNLIHIMVIHILSKILRSKGYHRWWLHDPGLPGWNFTPSSWDGSHPTITCGN